MREKEKQGRIHPRLFEKLSLLVEIIKIKPLHLPRGLLRI
jgi:hypothetical protein